MNPIHGMPFFTASQENKRLEVTDPSFGYRPLMAFRLSNSEAASAIHIPPARRHTARSASEVSGP